LAKLMQVLYGPYRDQRVHMPDADADQAIADGWAIDPHAPAIEPPFDVTVPEYADRVYEAAHAGAAKLREAVAEAPSAPPVVTSLLPAQATIGDPDFTLFITGQGFMESSVIHFAGHDEPTTLNGDGTLSTGVKPSLWGAPVVVQCSVRNGAVSSNVLDFTFVDPARSRAIENPIPQPDRGVRTHARGGGKT
jgi:hypothetical protein